MHPISLQRLYGPVFGMLFAAGTTALAQGPWPADVPGHKPIAKGEHPRLLFRKTDLPALRARAATPDGKALLQRLKVTLNGSDGLSLPRELGTTQRPAQDGAGPLVDVPAGQVLTLSHPAGYGFLYHMTGDKRFADLSQQAMQKLLDGHRGRDLRYSFRQPFGALRAGPAIGLVALGYDICYDIWPEDFRNNVAAALEDYNEGQHCSLEELVAGKRHTPPSNHWGMQVGGGALALLAITGDPGVKDQARIDRLLGISQKAMTRNVTEGFGDGGYFAEGDGTGSMASHIIYLTALQAWHTALGKDFVTPRPNVRWTALKYVLLTIPRTKDRIAGLRADFPERGGYPHNIWARAGGLSGAGYFSIGYRAVTPDEQAGLLWFYKTHIHAADEANKTPWDTPSPYPHHVILALVNTPFDLPPRNPAEVMPRNVRDTRHGFYGFRNRWQDENDIVISQLTRKSPARFAHGPDKQMAIWHHGKREAWGSIPASAKDWEPMADGSAIIGTANDWIAIDFSNASGAPGMIVATGSAAGPGGKTVTAGGTTFHFKFLTTGREPEPQVRADSVVIGDQTVSMENGKLRLGKTAGPWAGPSSSASPNASGAGSSRRGR